MKQHQRKVDAVFNSSKDMLLQHRIIIDALRSFFNASSEVTNAEFSLFSKDLLKIKSAVAFTLTPELIPAFISDPDYADVIRTGAVTKINNRVDKYILNGFETILIPIDEPKMPYLIYAISHERIQQKIDLNIDMCEHFILGEKKLDNIGCSVIKQSRLAGILNSHTEQKLQLKQYDVSYTLTVDTIPTRKELLEMIGLVLATSILGVSFSLLLFYIIQNRIKSDRERTETDSKFALLSTLNHEIRTPINAVLGYAQMLKNMKSCNNEGQVTLDKIIWSANLLNSVAQNTLTYTKAVSGPLVLHYEDVDLKEYLVNIKDYYQALSGTHKKSLILDIDDLPQNFFAFDTTKFFQLITNFINNAFKYSSGHTVIVKVSIKPNKKHLDTEKLSADNEVDGYIRVAVKDFGKGMSPESKLALTRPFTIDSQSATALKSGIGIGLYTCKKVIESVGGSIKIRSQLGKGTLVLFKFPYKKSTTKLEIKETTEYTTNPLNQITNSREYKAKSNDQGLDKRVILVDDNLFNLEVCKAMLETAGFIVYPVENESDLFNLLKDLNIKPEPQTNQDHANLIVLMDYKLADTDGLSIIRTMKNRGYWQIRYFILSANTKDEIPNSESFKDIDFLQKPLELEILKARLKIL
ncbi:hybrid sensor histidine kinase/response regulator [Shewanella colwelliana]|uniref:hybrid sensor histidine kinase/response regulator n=1 Tax=Shewanella colwelliana TaxID=23 RepID=UPI001B7FA274|nr:hybrid sensor histidine kinase/response regulator [Shewanella colwelliana]